SSWWHELWSSLSSSLCSGEPSQRQAASLLLSDASRSTHAPWSSSPPPVELSTLSLLSDASWSSQARWSSSHAPAESSWML
ncbi:MAG: hypothetical protein ACO33D_05155, partial [Ilumatobacteraceae bacterium]